MNKFKSVLFGKKEKKQDNEIEKRPEIKELGKEFFKEISGYSQSRKINLMYKLLLKKKPNTLLNNDQLLNRLLYTLKFGKYVKHTSQFVKNKKNKFKWPPKWKKAFRDSRKKRNQILVIFLNIKGEMELPRLYPLYSGNMVIIKNRPYEVDPRSFWRVGKYPCQLIKGIDRRPVSNLDYNEIKRRGDSTDSDEFLIKAALQAIVGVKKTKEVNKSILIVIGIIVVAAIVFFLSK